MAQRLRTRKPLLFQIAALSTKPARPVKSAKNEALLRPTSFVRFQDLMLPGSRLCYLQEEDGQRAQVSIPFLQSITQRVQLYGSNSLVEILGFESKTSNHFCDGIDTKQLSRQEQRECLIQLRDVNTLLANGLEEKPHSRDGRPISLVAFDGEVTDAGLTVFWQTKHRLASHNASFRVKALKEYGQLPLGGVASALVNQKHENIAMARYLGLSGARLNIADMIEMNLASQVSSARPLLSLFRHLAQSPHISEEYKREQPRQLDMAYLEEALDTMAVEEPALLEEIEAHEIWEQVLAVPPSAVDVTATASSSTEFDKIVYPIVAGNSWKDIQEMQQFAPEFISEHQGHVSPIISARFDHIDTFVETCFSAKLTDVKSITKQVNQYLSQVEGQLASFNVQGVHGSEKRHARIALERKQAAASACLETLQNADAGVIQTWLDLTRHAANKNFDTCLKDEITLMK